MRKNSNSMFYGVFGRNACGAYDDYGKVLESKPFVKGFKVKKFSTFSEAESFAIDGFCEYAYAKTPFPGIIIPEKLPLNWLVYPYKAQK